MYENLAKKLINKKRSKFVADVFIENWKDAGLTITSVDFEKSEIVVVCPKTKKKYRHIFHNTWLEVK